MSIDLPMSIDELGDEALHRQLYNQLRLAILEGRLAGLDITIGMRPITYR